MLLMRIFTCYVFLQVLSLREKHKQPGTAVFRFFWFSIGLPQVSTDRLVLRMVSKARETGWRNMSHFLCTLFCRLTHCRHCSQVQEVNAYHFELLKASPELTVWISVGLINIKLRAIVWHWGSCLFYKGALFMYSLIPWISRNSL